jgi:hypothetical protein
MGMYVDSVCARRTEWEYEYTASALLAQARLLLAKHTRLEREARLKSADLLRDVNVNQNDPRFNELKRDITTHGTLKEQCEVFVHEFMRNPDQVYKLGLGDVSFFELSAPGKP